MHCPYIYYQPAPDEKGRTLLLDPEEYRERLYIPVYGGEVPSAGGTDAMLERIFMAHNRDDRPRGKEIRSLSVGDVVVLKGNGVWLCERIGWTLLDADHIPPGVTV